MESHCEVCKKPAKQKCSGCLTVHYCSPAHQKDHWKSHKRNCSYFVIRDDPKHGKGFYASRDINAGTIIHEEKPFAFTPMRPPYNVSSCVGCGIIRRPGQAPLMKCSRCNWTYCSPECLQIHAENECNTFVSKQLVFPPVSKIDMEYICNLLLLIRAGVAKKKHPEIFQAIMQLRPNSDTENSDVDEQIEQNLGIISAFINAEDLQVSQEELKKLLKILRFNAHLTFCRAKLESPISPAPLAFYFYHKASQMQHSCVPNCNWVISWKPDFKIRVRTAVPVKKGESLTICYYMCGSIENRMDRMQNLLFNRGQRCNCWRCTDPTELGTFTSAVVCSNNSCKKNEDSVGYMLPEDPLDIDNTSLWRCNLCGVREAEDIVNYNQKQIGKAILDTKAELRVSRDCFGALISFCKQVIRKNKGKTVHPNHSIIQDATRTIMKYLPEYCKGSMDLETTQYYVNCGLYLLAIQDVVSPGISYFRAVLQRQIAAALQDPVTGLCLQNKYKEAMSNLEQSLTLQAEALAYFKDDFPNDPDEISDADSLRIQMKRATSHIADIASLLDDEFKCVVCGKQAYQNCPQCHLVTYCSTDHRQKHWKSHSKSCSCFVIKEGSGDANGFFALRNIEAGTVILEETPVVYGPSWDIPIFGWAALCVTCGIEMEIYDLSSPIRMCPKCKWYCCSLGCHMIHGKNECKIFELGGDKLNFPPIEPFEMKQIRYLILLIRATILKNKNPGIYQQILDLRSESTEPDHSDHKLEAMLQVLHPIVNSDGANIDQEELKKLLKILRINCYSTVIYSRINETSSSRFFGTDFLYLKATKMEQSCVPNCSCEVAGSPDFKIRIRVTKEVKEGEALTVNYNVNGDQQGTKERQKIIRKMRGSRCTCERCKDPSELGTYLSAIMCKVCTDTPGKSDKAYFLPEDPMDLSDSAKWKCNGCGQLKLLSIIVPLVKQIQTLIFKKAKECNEKSRFSTLINNCKTIIKENSGKILHPNHYALQEATRIIFQNYHEVAGNSMDLETSQYIVKCGMNLLAIQDIVSPGMTLSRAILQKQISNLLRSQNKELHAQKKHKEAHDNLQHCLKFLTEAFNIYKSVEGEGGRNATELKFEIDYVTASSEVLESALETKGSILVLSA